MASMFVCLNVCIYMPSVAREMYESVSFTLTVLVLFNWFSVGAFTVGSAQLCPNASAPCEDAYRWDTISQMITRDDRVRNGFAGFLVLSAVVLYFIISLIIERLDFYYTEIDRIGDIARRSETFEDFVASLQTVSYTHLTLPTSDLV